MDYSQLKMEAKEILQGNRLTLFGVMFVLAALTSIASSTIVGILIAPILSAGLYLTIKKLFVEKKIDFNYLFDFFKDLNHAGKLIILNIIRGLIIVLGLILFIIPGIIFAFQYSQAGYILADNPDMSFGDAMNKSKEMMNGYKLDLFIFMLSFILHYILVIITFGLYLIYLAPYFATAMVNYYRHLSKQNIIISDEINEEDQY